MVEVFYLWVMFQKVKIQYEREKWLVKYLTKAFGVLFIVFSAIFWCVTLVYQTVDISPVVVMAYLGVGILYAILFPLIVYAFLNKEI